MQIIFKFVAEDFVDTVDHSQLNEKGMLFITRKVLW